MDCCMARRPRVEVSIGARSISWHRTEAATLSYTISMGITAVRRMGSCWSIQMADYMGRRVRLSIGSIKMGADFKWCDSWQMVILVVFLAVCYSEAMARC